jgi:hypothetical protein
MPSMASCKYLIYTCWETKLDSGGTIAGSLLHDMCPQTEEEAKQMVAVLEKKSETFYDQFVSLGSRSRRYVYIKNRPEWW